MEFKWFFTKPRRIKITELLPEIICLQETDFTDRNSGKLSNYNGFGQNRTNGLRPSGGVEIYIRSDYPRKKITITAHIEDLAMSIKLNETEIYLCNNSLSNQHSFS